MYFPYFLIQTLRSLVANTDNKYIQAMFSKVKAVSLLTEAPRGGNGSRTCQRTALHFLSSCNVRYRLGSIEIRTIKHWYCIKTLDSWAETIPQYINCFQHGCRLRRNPVTALLLGLWIRIPPAEWIFVSCEYCVLSGRGLWDGLIPRPVKSYWECPCFIRASLLITLQFRMVHSILDKNSNTQSLL
jgi:hypothetical protein